MAVRIFARHLTALDPATEVPPGDMLPHHYRRIAPYLYSPAEITALMAAAGLLAPPLRAATWQTLIGLLAVTGMRQSEARHLDRDQVDLDAGVLTIADSKFGKARQLFLHPDRGRGAARLPAPPRPLVPRARRPQLLRVHPRHPAEHPHHHPCLRRPARRRRDRRPARAAPSEAA